MTAATSPCSRSSLDAALVIHADAGAGPRFGMLETVREYALDHLGGSGEERVLRDRHLAWFLALVEGDDVYWRRTLNAAWLALVELEHDNMRAAFAHARAVGDVERELRLACALRYFWRLRGYVGEGRRRLEEAVELSAGVDRAAAGAGAGRGRDDGVRRGRVRPLARALAAGAGARARSSATPASRAAP